VCCCGLHLSAIIQKQLKNILSGFCRGNHADLACWQQSTTTIGFPIIFSMEKLATMRRGTVFFSVDATVGLIQDTQAQ